MSKKIFYKDESPYYPGKYLIKIDLDAFKLKSTQGSFAVISARLFGISYADYLRMCRDHYGAEIIGKGSPYPVAYFKLTDKFNELISNLNARANYILEEDKNAHNS
jgi:hypothetical protein